MALLLEPSPELALRIRTDIARLNERPGAVARETTVPLEHGLGVWIVQVVLNEVRNARFLMDTGSSVTVLSPQVAAHLGVMGDGSGTPVELHTLGGRTVGRAATLASLRVGELELRDAPVVLHDPGPGLDGILGNTFLDRYSITIDSDRRQLRLLARD